jgi:CspA family cold shock protein
MLGTLRSFSTARGFGYIVADHDQRSFFVHVTTFDAAGVTPEPGSRLRFRIARDDEGRERAVELCELP